MEHEYLIPADICPIAFIPAPDEEKDLAILFLDIRNFTGLMESQPGRAVIQMVHGLFSRFNQVIKAFHGQVVEIAGDNLYAVFGMNASLREAANNAYQAAKTMFQVVNFFNGQYIFPHVDKPLEIGVGLHTGRVFVGKFGLDDQSHMTVMGLPVNIAARLQAKTKEMDNDMLISEDAYHLLEPDGNTFAQRTVNLQGVSEQQQIRLAGKPYFDQSYLADPRLDLNYLLAISG